MDLNFLAPFVLIAIVLVIVSSGLGYYIGERGTAGVKIDLDNTKMEIERLKNLVSKKTDTKATTVASTSSGAKATDTATRTTSAG